MCGCERQCRRLTCPRTTPPQNRWSRAWFFFSFPPPFLFARERGGPACGRNGKAIIGPPIFSQAQVPTKNRAGCWPGVGHPLPLPSPLVASERGMDRIRGTHVNTVASRLTRNETEVPPLPPLSFLPPLSRIEGGRIGRLGSDP